MEGHQWDSFRENRETSGSQGVRPSLGDSRPKVTVVGLKEFTLNLYNQ